MFQRLIVRSSVFVLGFAVAGAAWAQQAQQQQQQPGQQQQPTLTDQQRQQQQLDRQRQLDQQRQQQQFDRQQQQFDRDSDFDRRQPTVDPLRPPETEGPFLRDPDLARAPADVRDREAPHIVSGTITGVREDQRNLHVQVNTFDEQRITIDLGPAQQARELRNLLEQGERITVRGSQQTVAGQPVFVADHVRVAGERFDLTDDARLATDTQDRTIREDRDRFDRDRDFQRDRLTRDEFRDRDQIRDRQQERTVSGTVTEVRETQQMGERHLYVTVRSQDDQWYTVDLGPAQQAREVRGNIREGERITITGRQKTLDGRQVFAANQVQVAGQRFNLDDWAQQARYREDQQLRDRDMDRDRMDLDRDRQLRDQEQLRRDPQRFDQQRDQQQLDQQRQWQRDQQQLDQQRQWQRDQRQFDQQRQQQLDQQRQQQFDQQRQWQRDQQRRDQQTRDGERAQRQSPDGYVLVSERVILLMTDQLNRHFVNARTQLQQGNADRAAAEARLASEYLDMYTGIAEGDAQNQLESVRDDLRQAADKIREGELTERGDLDRKFVKAHRALAKYNLEQARELKDEDRNVAAGYRLQAASRHIQQASAFSDRQIDQDATRAFQEAQQASSRMIQGQDVQEKDQLLQRLEQQLERIGDDYN